ncbi:MAG TPA: inorganic diphosphatase [Myxococcales bacterium]|nr:inorganic diphosphatase [Myxococcales bacterium]
MRASLTALPTFRKDGSITAVVEVPRGSGIKFRYDPEADIFEYGRTLPLGITYPYCFGFIPGTRAEDGDPLDVLVLTEAPTFPGVVIPVRLIGVVELSQKDEGGERVRNDRLIAVPWEETRTHEDLTDRQRQEIERFFLNSVFFTPKHAKVRGWKGPAAAGKLIRQARKRAA